MNETVESQSSPSPQIRPKPPLWQRLLPWLITLACFAYLTRFSTGQLRPREVDCFST